jgi:CxxC motif-containing protein (DUF1111 family)
MASFKLRTLMTGLLAAAAMQAQTDPGPRPGPPTLTRPLMGLTASDLAYFQQGLSLFQEVDSVSGTQPGADGSGLGPRFNGNSCAQCHAHPSVGGTSPPVNPQIAMATSFGAQNRVPSFLQQNGPIRVARFRKNPDGSADGGVHALFVVSGRSDAPGCRITQPDFEAAVRQRNVIFRIPTPVLGAGLIEAISETAILNNLATNTARKRQLGIGGHENRNGNDGSITRFGWKAQNKSILLFAGEAYNVEQGVTNELFPNEREEAPGCSPNGAPEDHSHLDAQTAISGMSDLMGFVHFMRLSAPSAAGQVNAAQQRGSDVFEQIGCAECHTPRLRTGVSSTAALSQKPVQLYSDLIVHNMGRGLADGVAQGSAQGDEFRTAPLWGLGSRLFFLHDGRTSDLVEAIRAHQSPGSEASRVVDNFNQLPPQARQDLMDFLRTL